MFKSFQKVTVKSHKKNYLERSILNAMDWSLGSFSLSRIGIIRSIEGLKENESGFMISLGKLRNTQNDLARQGNQIITLMWKATASG